MRVRFYYDQEGYLTTDDEGNLVQLCDRCAREHADQVAWAGDGAECCELCDGELVMRWDLGLLKWVPVEAANA